MFMYLLWVLIRKSSNCFIHFVLSDCGKYNLELLIDKKKERETKHNLLISTYYTCICTNMCSSDVTAYTHRGEYFRFGSKCNNCYNFFSSSLSKSINILQFKSLNSLTPQSYLYSIFVIILEYE